jgi:O-antigen ligase
VEIDRHALELIAERPVIGVGSGGFRSAYESKARGTQHPIVDNPHNAFLQVGVELGLIGLAMLIALLTVQWRAAGTIGDINERVAARGFVVMFVAASLLSSTLDNHPEGLFYAWASGILFATARRPASN